jgi:hypothetical protein
VLFIKSTQPEPLVLTCHLYIGELPEVVTVNVALAPEQEETLDITVMNDEQLRHKELDSSN